MVSSCHHCHLEPRHPCRETAPTPVSFPTSNLGASGGVRPSLWAPRWLCHSRLIQRVPFPGRLRLVQGRACSQVRATETNRLLLWVSKRRPAVLLSAGLDLAGSSLGGPFSGSEKVELEGRETESSELGLCLYHTCSWILPPSVRYFSRVGYVGQLIPVQLFSCGNGNVCWV